MLISFIQKYTFASAKGMAFASRKIPFRDQCNTFLSMIEYVYHEYDMGVEKFQETS